MSRIDDLIADRCPSGVPSVPLESVAAFRKGKQLKIGDRIDGPFPVVTAGRTSESSHDDFNFDAGSVTVSSHGAHAGQVNYWPTPIWLSNNVFLLSPNRQHLTARYLYFVLQSRQDRVRERVRSGGVPYMNAKDLATLRLPLPPLEVQREIVRVLDKFTQLETELEAELEARRAQYQHYRHSAVGKPRFANNEWVPLASIADIRTGAKPEQISDCGAFPYVNAGTEPSGFTNRANSRGNVVTIPSRGQGGAGHVGYQGDDFWCGPLCYRIESKSRDLLTRFLYFYLRNVQGEVVALRKIGSIPAVNKSDLGTILIPVVPLEEQRRVVEVLDKFDTLVNDISIGLPAELAARRKQYEHYRDRLLTFKELAS